MSSSVHRARRKYAAALLSPSSLHHLRILGQFAAQLGGEEGMAMGDGRAVVVLLVSPLGKVWRAELRRADGGGGGSSWQLGGAWAEFAAAHGIGAGWSVVFRLGAARGGHGVTAGKNRPRFMRVLHTEDLEKMKIHDKFVQEHLTGSCSSTQKAMVFSPLGKLWHVELDRGQSGVLLGDGWAQFLTTHNLSERNILLFRYEDNMVFTVEAFLQNGYSKEYGAAAADMTDDLIVIGLDALPALLRRL
ncbi:putative B3 domain-containing protein Os06g0632500 [Miscanthus floridulus]|uniref:putative B3 domain-containing protein Os06g0632500 n=1 Tax=Miscanthus floridulus TaxID=154761 RepID=UPI00345A5CD6